MKFLFLSSVLLFTGCAVKAIDVQTITIEPNTKPVVVTIKGTGISTDMLIVHTAQIFLDIQSSDGAKAIRVGGPSLK